MLTLLTRFSRSTQNGYKQIKDILTGLPFFKVEDVQPGLFGTIRIQDETLPFSSYRHRGLHLRMDRRTLTVRGSLGVRGRVLSHVSHESGTRRIVPCV